MSMGSEYWVGEIMPYFDLLARPVSPDAPALPASTGA